MNKYEHFSDDELYILKRQAIESSARIVISGTYSENEIITHASLLNGTNDEIKRRHKSEVK